MATQLDDAPDEKPDSGAMSDSELAAMLAGHEANAVGYFNGEVADEQTLSLDYYYGRPFGDEQAGRSQVVDRTVAIVVDNAVAALLRPFVSAQEVVTFEPKGPEDEETAKQATDYVNYVFANDNNGFLLMHDWFKAACLEKLGVIKCWWQENKKTERVEGLDAASLEMLQQDQSEKIVGGPYMDHDGTFAIDIERIDGRIKIITVPSEEFLINPFARNIETAEYVAHKPTNITRSDLIDMGMDPAVVDGLPAEQQDTTYESRSQTRWQDEQGIGSLGMSSDRSRDRIAIRDEYPLVDYDGDGIAERRRVIRVDGEILYNEAIDDNPFSLLCPVPMPHKIYGLSLADQSRDLQRIQSVLWRQTLDNLYLANNPKTEVAETHATNDGATYTDLMDPAPGGIIRVKTIGGIVPYAIPFVADKAFPMLQYAEAQQEARTGVGRGGQGIDPETIRGGKQVTATEIAEMVSGKNARVEMIARIFAETGVKRLFRLMLKLMVNHQPRERVIRLRNQWVPIDPRSWNDEMDVTISVGLGVGSKMEQIAQADSVLQTMEVLGASPYGYLLSPENVYAAVKRKFTASGIKNVDDYLTEPGKDGQQPPPPPPDPEMVKAQSQAQIAQQKAIADEQASQRKLQLNEQEAAHTAQLQALKAQAEATLAEQQLRSQIALREQEIQLNHQAQLRQAELDHEHRMHKTTLDAETARHVATEKAKEGISKNREGGALNK